MDSVNQDSYRVQHPLYDTWRGMRRRCQDPAARSYEYYGGKGIKVCDEWQRFRPFEAWIMANLGSRPDSMTLDRIDGFGNYEPGNVRWATQAQQRATRMPPRWEWPEFAERRQADAGHSHVSIGDGALVSAECTDLECR